MKTFEVIYALSKNKANVGDKYKIDGANREVIKITNSYVYLDNKNYFPVKMFGTWMRIAKAIEERDELSLIKAMKLDHKKKEIAIMHKEAKAIYDGMIADGIAKECARFVLPLATPTRLYMSGSIRSWIHYINLRSSHGTQKEHMEIANQSKQVFIDQLPIVSEALGWK